MTDHNLYLAIDQGGHASRALVFDALGRMVAQGYAEIGVARPRSSWVEHDPNEVVIATRRAIDVAVSALGARSRNIVSAGLATQRSSIVCWDLHTGTPLSPIISWQDRRAADFARRFYPQEDHIHRLTGLFVTAHYGFSKLRWCFDNLPEVRTAAAAQRLAWGPMASYLLFRLLDERPMLVDPANASRTLLWNIEKLDWDPELLEMFGLPTEPLPRCVSTRHHYGSLHIEDRTIPLTVCTGDQSAALFAFGEPQPSVAYANIGTGAFVQRPSGGFADYSPRLLTSVVLQEGNEARFVLEGTVNGAGSALVEIEQQLGIDARAAQEQIAQWLNVSRDPPLFLNGISGLGAPYWIPEFPTRFVGEGSAPEKLVAVAESIVFLLCVNLAEMGHLFVTPKNICITGGLAQLDGLCQRLADVSELSVYRPLECEATARGTAYILAERPLQWPESAPGRWFMPQDNEALKLRFVQWKREMEREVARHAG